MRIPDVLRAFAAVEGRPGSSVRESAKRKMTSSTSTLSPPPPPPPPPSPPPVGRHLFYPSAANRGA